MKHIIKSNIESKFSSLQEGAKSVSLFTDKKISGDALYLHEHEEFATKKSSHQTLLCVFSGSGELQTQENGESLQLQLIKGDVILIPTQHDFRVANTSKELLLLSIFTM